MSIAGKVVIITGGASGIGRASALLLAQHGATVVVADRDTAAAQAVAGAITDAGGSAVAATVDVAESARVDRLVATCRDRWGRVDVLVHCAGICPRAPVLDMSDEEWHRVLRVNLDGTFFVARAVGRVMLAQKSGTMILLTSDRGRNGAADYAHYAASKGRMIALAKSLAIALGPYGVTVNSLNPGMTDTPLARGAIPDASWAAKQHVDVMGTHSEPAQVAEIILFLAGTAGDVMTGQIVATRMRNFA
jgi:NAD(P)-dependent dehydrogenase (short-subunit alcohol dehydrogenase family)